MTWCGNYRLARECRNFTVCSAHSFTLALARCGTREARMNDLSVTNSSSFFHKIAVRKMQTFLVSV